MPGDGASGGGPSGGEAAETRRVFVAITPPDELAERIATRVGRVAEGVEGLRCYPGRDLHVTLCFLGQLEEARIHRLAGALPEELRGTWAPELSLGDMQAFPGEEDPRVLWLGVEEEGDRTRLAALAARVLGAAQTVGWRPGRAERERPFLPHLTVARRGAGSESVPASLWTIGSSQRWFPTDVTLYESRPDQPEERYHPLVSIPLVVGPG